MGEISPKTLEYQGIEYSKVDHNGELCDSPLFEYIEADVAGASMASVAGFGNFADNLTAKFIRKPHTVKVTIQANLDENGFVETLDFTFFSESLFERKESLLKKAKEECWTWEMAQEAFEFGEEIFRN